MNWIGHHRPLPGNWKQLRGAVHRRSGGRCEFIITGYDQVRRHPTRRRCSKTADGGVDHIDRHGPHELWNLRDLCTAHHQRKTQQEAQEAKALKRNAGKRAPERHPGEIIRRQL